MQYIRPALAASIGVVILLVSGPAIADRDDEVAARAKAALTANGIADAADVVVASFNGEVDLSGTVRSEHVRAEAARVVGAVAGVTAVRNELAVLPPGGDRDADQVIADRVRTALAAAAIPGARDVTVAVFNGAVELSGIVADDDIRATAGRVAGEVRGATAVRNSLVVRRP